MSDVYQLLENWGRWSRDGCLPHGVKCGIAIIMEQNIGSTVGIAPANDYDAERIERVMVIMKLRKPDHYHALRRYYIMRLSTRKIAKLMDCGNSKASDLVRAGEAWVEGALSVT